jgi:AsmA protein
MRWVLGFVIVLVLAVGVLLALPFLIDLNQYQDRYKPAIEEALNRKIGLQDIRLTLWPRVGARVAGFTVLDDPAFGSDPFASLTSLDVAVQLVPLFSGRVEVEEITLRDPVITVIKNKNGVLNVSTLGRPGVEAPDTPSRAPVPSPGCAAHVRPARPKSGGAPRYRGPTLCHAGDPQRHDRPVEGNH